MPDSQSGVLEVKYAKVGTAFRSMGPGLIQVAIPSLSIHKIDHLHGIRSDSIAFIAWSLIRGTGIEGHDDMPGAIELSISDADVAKLMSDCAVAD